MVLVVKNLPANARDIRDAGSIPGSGRSPGGENGNPLQYSSLGNPMNRGLTTVHRVTKSRSLADQGPWGRTELDTTEVTQHWQSTWKVHLHVKCTNLTQKIHPLGSTQIKKRHGHDPSAPLYSLPSAPRRNISDF